MAPNKTKESDAKSSTANGTDPAETPDAGEAVRKVEGFYAVIDNCGSDIDACRQLEEERKENPEAAEVDRLLNRWSDGEDAESEEGEFDEVEQDEECDATESTTAAMEVLSQSTR